MADDTQETQPGLNRSEEVYLIREAEGTLQRLGAEPGQPVDAGRLGEAWQIVDVPGGFAIRDTTSDKVLDVRRTVRSDIWVIIRQVLSHFAA
jgi:predicted NUDIX family NTP pyrophosphohydrolase